MVKTALKEKLFSKDASNSRVKTPSVFQMEAVECGAAALGIILGFFGKYVPLEELRVTCGVSRDGAKASNIIRAALVYGLEGKGLRKEPADLKKMKMPVILYWDFNHFVVLEGFRRGKVYINDPARGPVTIAPEDLNRSFTGIVLTFKTTGEFEKSTYRPSIYRSLRKRLSGLSKGLTLIVTLGLYLVIPGILIPAYSRIFVDDILLAGKTDWLFPLIIGMLVTLLAQGALIWFRQYYLLQLETRLAISSSGKYLWHVLRLPAVFFYQRMAGEISYRVHNNDRVAMLLTGQLATAFLDLVVIGFFFLIMLQYDAVLALIALAFALLNMLFLKQAARKRRDDGKRMIQERGKIIGITMNGLQMIETLKATGGEDDFFARWAGYQANIVATEQELGRTSHALLLIPQMLMALATATVLIVGGYRVIDGMLTIGMLVAFQGLMLNFMEPVSRIVNLGTLVHEVEADLAQLDDVMNHRLDPELAPTAGEVTGAVQAPAKLSGRVTLKDVCFGYGRLDEPQIIYFNLDISPGSRVALVGPSGSGKSTVARLMAGLYRPWSGEILFDGINRQNLSRAVINSSVAIVDQNINLLEGTIRENITLWNESIPEAGVTRAARDARIDAVISQKTGGYDGMLYEGGRNLSGGERQRIDIARALSNDPTILIMDEATSALDTLTEKEIDENIRARGCTCIIVAHRLSTIRDCDEIIVLENGRIVERGTHDELVERGGPYLDLVTGE